MDHPDKAIDVSCTYPPRCIVEVVWKGLFVIRQAILKILNNNSAQSESLDVETIAIHMISPEVWAYILLSCQGKAVSLQEYNSKDSYLDIDATFLRGKIRTLSRSRILRFQTKQDLDVLRSILGFGATYGSLEKRPTLSDGEEGVHIQPGHHLSVVRGIIDGEEVPKKFRRYSRNPRVDLVWNKCMLRVVVCYSHYRYDVNPDGTLTLPTPTAHMKSVLLGLCYNRTLYSSSSSVSVSPASESLEENQTNNVHGSTPRLHQPEVFLKDQFCREGTVYEVVDFNPSRNVAIRLVVGGVLYDDDLDKKEQDKVSFKVDCSLEESIAQYQ